MSTDIHRIKILDKKDNVLTFKTFLIYRDWTSLPRTHGFGLMVLMDIARESRHAGSALKMSIGEQNYIDHNYELARKYISKITVTDFENFPIKEEFLQYWEYDDEKTYKYHEKNYFPQAVYTMEVTDPKWLEHMRVGEEWTTTSCDLDGPSWYLECKQEGSNKFYRVYEKMGVWKIHYGPLNATGREDNIGYAHRSFGESKVKEKLRPSEGYTLVYKNFDTPFGYEEEVTRKEGQKSKEALKPAENEEMFKAIEEDNVEQVKNILESGFDLENCKDKYERPVLESAADSWRAPTESRMAIIKLLLEYGANPNVGGFGPFFPSICYSMEREAVAKLFVEHGKVDITLIGGVDKHSVLQCASNSGMLWLVKKAIDAGADVMHRSAQGHTALHYATTSEQNSIEIIDLLLANGADLHDCNGNWGTPFMWSVKDRDGRPEIVKHLFSLGADVNAKTSGGDQAIHRCAEYGLSENLQVLIELGADLTQPNSKGLSLMNIAVERLLGYSEEISKEAMAKIKLLKSKGLSLTSGHTTSTALLLSKIKANKKLEVFYEKALIDIIDLGLDLGESDAKGFTLLHFASKINNVSILKSILSKSGFNVNAQDEYGWTPLHYAVCHKKSECVQLLLKAGINKELKSKKSFSFLKVKVESGKTAMEVAKAFGNLGSLS